MLLFLPSLKTPIPTISDCEASYLDTRPFERGCAESQGGSSFLPNTVGFNKGSGESVIFQSAGRQALLIAPIAQAFLRAPAFSFIFLRSGPQGASLNAQRGLAPHDFSLNPLCAKTINPSQVRTPRGWNPRMDNKMN
jgi:hypothetical protein